MDTYQVLLILIGAVIVVLLQGIAHRLSALQAQQQALMHHLGMRDAEPSAEVRALASDPQRRIEAIRLYREQTGKGLKDAVAAIDKL